MSSADFFSKRNFFQKLLQKHYQTVEDVLSLLTKVQTVCKGYQQTTKVAAGKERVNKTEGINTEYPNEKM